MHLINLLLLLLFFMLHCYNHSEDKVPAPVFVACQYYVGAEGEGGAEADNFILARKKRTTDEDRADKTEVLRDYFTACMNTLLPESDVNWRSSVDFTVLDTLWYLNTDETYCSPSVDGATPECWKSEITSYLVEGSDTLSTSQTCIDHFAEDTYAEPPTNRYEQKRKKRDAPSSLSSSSSSSSSSPSSTSSLVEDLEEAEPSLNLTELNDYDSCVTSQVSYTLRRQQLNFTQLSLFVAVATTDGCDRKRGNRTKMGPRFTSRFVALTRPDSSLRNPLNACQKEKFPPASFWGSWGGFSKCSVTCDEGVKRRRRGCRSGVNPRKRATDCPGEAREFISCNRRNCSLGSPYSWGEWSDFSNCSQSCGPGTKQRTRSCFKKRVAAIVMVNETFCEANNGTAIETSECNVEDCSLLSWGQWSRFGDCTVTRGRCGRGRQIFTRNCKRGKKNVQPSKCSGSFVDTRTCFKAC